MGRTKKIAVLILIVLLTVSVTLAQRSGVTISVESFTLKKSQKECINSTGIVPAQLIYAADIKISNTTECDLVIWKSIFSISHKERTISRTNFFPGTLILQPGQSILIKNIDVDLYTQDAVSCFVYKTAGKITITLLLNIDNTTLVMPGKEIKL